MLVKQVSGLRFNKGFGLHNCKISPIGLILQCASNQSELTWEKVFINQQKPKNRSWRFTQQKEQSLDFTFEKRDVTTSFGSTRVLIAGNPQGKKIVLFHGVHAGAPLTLASVKGLLPHFHLFALDTIGQATKSDEATVNLKDDSFARWADEVLDALAITKAIFTGISYGAFILQKLITHRPQKVDQCVFVVPSGLANGKVWPSLQKLTFPLIKFQITKSDADLKRFIKSFVPEEDTYMFNFQKALLLSVNLDYRRPAILQPTDVAHFDQPVYLMLADTDVFFPMESILKQAHKVFPNLADVHILKNCKHMPNASHLDEIAEKVQEWVG